MWNVRKCLALLMVFFFQVPHTAVASFYEKDDSTPRGWQKVGHKSKREVKREKKMRAKE